MEAISCCKRLIGRKDKARKSLRSRRRHFHVVTLDRPLSSVLSRSIVPRVAVHRADGDDYSKDVLPSAGRGLSGLLI